MDDPGQPEVRVHVLMLVHIANKFCKKIGQRHIVYVPQVPQIKYSKDVKM
jgi:hypothetical protein